MESVTLSARPVAFVKKLRYRSAKLSVSSSWQLTTTWLREAKGGGKEGKRERGEGVEG